MIDRHDRPIADFRDTELKIDIPSDAHPVPYRHL